MALAIGIMGVLIGAIGVGLATRSSLQTWTSQGVHFNVRRPPYLTNRLRIFEIRIRLIGPSTVHEAEVVTWGVKAVDPPDQLLPSLDCNTARIETTLLVEPPGVEHAWVGLIWTQLYWGSPREQGYRINLQTNENERWYWTRRSYLPGMSVRGQWRADEVTPVNRLTRIPRDSDGSDWPRL